MEEISYSEWVSNAGAGMVDTPRFEQLHKLAEEGKLIVIDSDGKRYVPISKEDRYWELVEQKK